MLKEPKIWICVAYFSAPNRETLPELYGPGGVGGGWVILFVCRDFFKNDMSNLSLYVAGENVRGFFL